MIGPELVFVTALVLFLITHVDTLLVLVAFFADGRYYRNEIVVGHVMGFGIGLLIPIIIVIAAPDHLRDLGFLFGVVPLAMGLWGFFRRQQADEPDHPPEVLDGASRVLIVLGAGIGLSGENIAIYVPFFLTLSEVELGVVTILYSIGGLGLLVLAQYLSEHPGTARVPVWIEQRLVPATLTLVGVYVLITGWLALP